GAAERSSGQSFRSLLYYEAKRNGHGTTYRSVDCRSARWHDYGREPARSRRAHGCPSAGSSWPHSKEQGGRMSNSSEVEAGEVCLVDDDVSVLKSMHYLLASEGFKVRPFNRAEDFLAHASKNPVPVVVTDIWMDGVTGLEVLARLCAIS